MQASLEHPRGRGPRALLHRIFRSPQGMSSKNTCSPLAQDQLAEIDTYVRTVQVAASRPFSPERPRSAASALAIGLRSLSRGQHWPMAASLHVPDARPLGLPLQNVRSRRQHLQAVRGPGEAIDARAPGRRCVLRADLSVFSLRSFWELEVVDARGALVPSVRPPGPLKAGWKSGSRPHCRRPVLGTASGSGSGPRARVRARVR